MIGASLTGVPTSIQARCRTPGRRNLCLVPYGGLLAGELVAGETVLISGATGDFGSAAVTVALVMGAGCFVAPGRNQQVLNDLEDRFGPRLRTVPLSGDQDQDRTRMAAAAPGPIYLVLDLLPPSAGSIPAGAAAMTVRDTDGSC